VRGAAIAYSKYVAAGNDFLIVAGDEPPSTDETKALCDGSLGVGADGLIWAGVTAGGSFRMALRNADGSSAEMSGNGIRCLAAYLFDRGWVRAETFDIDTPAGVKRVSVRVRGGTVGSAKVEMGKPSFGRASIPMHGDGDATFLAQPIDVGDGIVGLASALSMGNPHLVVFLGADPGSVDVAALGPYLENHVGFPMRTNVEFALVRDEGAIDARVWERGVGETLSCGTGACAIAVAAQEAGTAGPVVGVRFPGGELHVERLPGGGVTLSGPVERVADGSVTRGTLR
jgi:diaminopimelate epimerase